MFSGCFRIMAMTEVSCLGGACNISIVGIWVFFIIESRVTLLGYGRASWTMDIHCKYVFKMYHFACCLLFDGSTFFLVLSRGVGPVVLLFRYLQLRFALLGLVIWEYSETTSLGLKVLFFALWKIIWD